MSVLMSTVILGMAWFAALNAAASLIAVIVSGRISGRIEARAGRARRLLALRCLPFAFATTVTLGLFVPAHLRLEPPNPDERFGFLPLGLAVAGVVLLATAAWKSARLAIAAARLGIYATQPIAKRGVAPLVEIPLFHGIALAGVLRPRVLIGFPARQALTAAELEVAVAHELAHQEARDNLTRVLMLCLPDFFGFTPAARRIEQLWGGEAECLADARAVAGNPERATRLASALVKVARLATVEDRALASPGWSTFHHSELLETRVRLLVEGAPAHGPVGRSMPIVVLCLLVVVAAAWLAGLPQELHWFTEEALAFLP